MLLAGAITLGLASCDTNSWNDRYLDGFEGGVDYTSQSVTAEFSLTTEDYETISSLLLATASNRADSTAATAIKTNHYFDNTSSYPATVAVRTFLANGNSPYYYAAVKSVLDVSYNEVSATPAELGSLSAAYTYTVSTDDYQNAWGSDDDYIDAFAPMLNAGNKLPGILAGQYPDAVEGDYAVVTYAVAQENPIFGEKEAATYSIVIYAEDTFSEAGGYVCALPISTASAYSYLNGEHISVVDGIPTGYSDDAIWTLTETMGGYFLSDANGTFLYGSDRYNNFYWAAAGVAGDDTFTFVVEDGENGNTLNCVGAGKWMQYTSYGNFGEYNYQSGNSAHVYFLDAAASRSAASRTVINTPVTVTQNSVYYFNGSAWSVAEGVTVLNPADYTAMGFTNNNLSDADIYIPLYLKNAKPYAQDGDQVFVVYNVKTNSSSVGLFVFDGSTWTLNNNGLETVTGRYVRNSQNWNVNDWAFQKYIGKAVYDLFTMDQIELDKSYILVGGSVCATPVPTGSSYGYLQATSVSVSGTQIVMSNDANAFTFATTYTYNGTTGKVPEGQFLILDSNGRYLYLQGTYNSFNVRADAPYIESDGSVGTGYLFKATKNDDNTWTITNVGVGKNMYYSAGYNNFAGYESGGANDVMPFLYQLSE